MSAQIAGESNSILNGSGGPIRPNRLIVCWFSIQTEYGNFSSLKIPLHTISSDFDSDGLESYQEYAYYDTDPYCNDTDQDLLSDYDEIMVYDTNPLVPDSDSDGMDDHWEITNNLDPLDASDASQDYDGDGLTNFQEYSMGSDPWNFFSVPLVSINLFYILCGALIALIIVVYIVIKREYTVAQFFDSEAPKNILTKSQIATIALQYHLSEETVIIRCLGEDYLVNEFESGRKLDGFGVKFMRKKDLNKKF